MLPVLRNVLMLALSGGYVIINDDLIPHLRVVGDEVSNDQARPGECQQD